MWYSNLYRRHLCDMHIDDWNPEFLSLFSPEEYVKNLTRAHINYAMLYFQSHAGLCYYPTKVGQMHRGLIGRESLMRDTLELCHSNNIKVIGYYSLQYNTREHDRHPQWRIVNPDGQSMRASNQSAGGALPLCLSKIRTLRSLLPKQCGIPPLCIGTSRRNACLFCLRCAILRYAILAANLLLCALPKTLADGIWR